MEAVASKERGMRDKTGWLPLAAAKAAKFIKLLKPFITLITAAGSVFAYSFALGWEFSAGFVSMLMVHELGHVAVARRLGMKASAPIFIPFLGAAIFMKDMGSREDEARIGIGGPLVGGAAAILLLVLVVTLSHPPDILIGVCYLALFLNLINLLPVRPLDGGRIMQATGKLYRYFAVPAILALPFLLGAVFYMIIWILALTHVKTKPQLRMVLGILIQVAMLALMIAGVGRDTDLFSIIFVMVLSTIWNISLAGQVRGGMEGDEVEDDQPVLRIERRRFWLLCYVTLTFVLGAATVIVHGYLPYDSIH